MNETGYRVQITLTNETEGHVFSEWAEPIDEDDLVDGKPDMGQIYRQLRAEYGRCRSSVYVDRVNGPPKRVGWFFESRQQYDRTGEPYLRGAWCMIERVVEPAQPVTLERVNIDA